MFPGPSCCCWYLFSSFIGVVYRLDVEVGWSQLLLSLVCLTSLWNSSCAGLLLLCDTLVHMLFSFCWEISMFCVWNASALFGF
jgi:hypothetical protein